MEHMWIQIYIHAHAYRHKITQNLTIITLIEIAKETKKKIIHKEEEKEDNHKVS